jgi:hypothetical protein
VIRRLWRSARRGLTRNTAVTQPGEEDPRLRGRTYAIPFEEVWQAALRLADGGMQGWSLLEQDDQEGAIRGTARGLFRRFDSEISIRIVLDEDAQTRVDAASTTEPGRGDLGVNARRVGRFFRALDRALERAPVGRHA